MYSALGSGTPVIASTRREISCIRGALEQAVLHQALVDVRDSSKEALKRPESSMPPTLELRSKSAGSTSDTTASASSAVRKVSSVTTQGSREWTTTGPKRSHSPASMRRKVSLICPGSRRCVSDSFLGHRNFGSRKRQVAHERAHSRVIYVGLDSHSPAAAQDGHSVLLSSQSTAGSTGVLRWHVPQLTGQYSVIYPLFLVHSPTSAHA
mmetsp:Transcript_23153/g.68231  ORF Transcript_23153/g.68231 Transcript_23153/m.68231 type:complete len:209 (+) Transcript_23153:506-1132(+)